MEKNEIKKFTENILSNPGDKFSAEITKTGKKVAKISKNNGQNKYSITQYTNGTIVETKTTTASKDR